VFLADRVLVMTARPGRLLDNVRVDLARPRALEVMNTPEFGRYVKEIRAQFNSKGGLDG
jgi:NitT/TauT family transport system ATP-binding protein